MTDKHGINNPLNLSPAEKPYYDSFLADIGRQPESFAELMGYAVEMQEQNKQFSQFLGGVLGL